MVAIIFYILFIGIILDIDYKIIMINEGSFQAYWGHFSQDLVAPITFERSQ